MREIHNEYLDYRFSLPNKVTRVVSLVSSATEALDHMGLLDRVIGVSEYCGRYVDDREIPTVGQYLNADFDQIIKLKPELIVTTTGIQRHLARKIQKSGLPIYQLTLPASFEGMLENIIVLGGLVNELEKARCLVRKLRLKSELVREASNAFNRPPRIYVELWLGRHMRAVGGYSYIADLVEMSGGELFYKNHAEGYFTPDFEEAKQADLFVCFHEPEYLVDGAQLASERGWNMPIIMSTVDCGENVIQDGPSLLDTAEWLYKQVKAKLGELSQ